MNIVEVLEYAGPAIAAGVGSMVATKVSVARLQADVKVLFKKVDQLASELHEANIEREKESSEVKVEVARLSERVNAMRAPWNRSEN